MQFLWVQHTFGKLNGSFLILNNGVAYAVSQDANGTMTEQGIRFSQTIGPNVSMALGKLKVSGNFYAQTGTHPSGLPVQAYEFLVEGNVSLSDKLSAGLSYEMLSGMDPDETETFSAFTPFYGTNHKFNGHMDYFYVGNHVGSVGLQDVTASVAIKIKKLTLNAHIHGFLSAVDLPGGKCLGTEADIFAVYPIADNMKIQVGYSQMFATESLQTLKAGSSDVPHNWAYLMFSFSPKFI